MSMYSPMRWTQMPAEQYSADQWEDVSMGELALQLEGGGEQLVDAFGEELIASMGVLQDSLASMFQRGDILFQRLRTDPKQYLAVFFMQDGDVQYWKRSQYTGTLTKVLIGGGALLALVGVTVWFSRS